MAIAVDSLCNNIHHFLPKRLLAAYLIGWLKRVAPP